MRRNNFSNYYTVGNASAAASISLPAILFPTNRANRSALLAFRISKTLNLISELSDFGPHSRSLRGERQAHLRCSHLPPTRPMVSTFTRRAPASVKESAAAQMVLPVVYTSSTRSTAAPSIKRDLATLNARSTD